MNTYKIISNNGGGVRGIFTVRILQRLNEAVPLIDNTNLFAGVSTGGLISLALAHGLELHAIKDFYMNECKNIFKDNLFDDVKDLFGVAGADYDIKNLETVLKNVFGNTRVNELKRKVLVTAFDLDNEDPDINKRSWVPLIISNLSERYNANNFYAFQAGCCTSAAPIYFPAYDGIVDGGIINSNCSMDAICAVWASRDKKTSINSEQILLLNVGTGVSLQFIEGKDLDLGYAKWAKKIIPAMMYGDDLSIDNQCRELLGNNYMRIAPVLPRYYEIPMDAYEKMDFLIELADSINLEHVILWLKEKWR